MPLYYAILTHRSYTTGFRFAANDQAEANRRIRSLALSLSSLDGPIGISEGPTELCNASVNTYCKMSAWYDAVDGTPCPELMDFTAYKDAYHNYRLKVAGGLSPEEALWLLPF